MINLIKNFANIFSYKRKVLIQKFKFKIQKQKMLKTFSLSFICLAISFHLYESVSKLNLKHFLNELIFNYKIFKIYYTVGNIVMVEVLV